MNDRATGLELQGYLAEFGGPNRMLRAIELVKKAGYERVEAYSPYPIEEISHALGAHSKLPWIVLAGGITGALSGWALQYFTSVHAYPMNIGGKPFNSWPAFIVVIFEMTILFAAFAAVLGMFALNGLPRPYHPLFNVERFALASKDRYFLYILADDPKFDLKRTWDLLEKTECSEVTAVED